MSKDSNRIEYVFAEDDKRTLQVGDFLKLCLEEWKWFVFSVVAFLAIGMFWVLRQQPVYERTEQVLIKDQDSGGSTGDLSSAFSSMGLLAAKTSVYNEVVALRSPAIMSEVVQRLDLCNSYFSKGTFHWTTLYGTNLPFTVIFSGKDIEKKGGSFRATLMPDGTVKFSEFYSRDEKGKPVKHEKEITARIGATVANTPIGSIQLMANPQYTGVRTKNMEMQVSHSSIDGTIEEYAGKLKVDLTDQDAEVIDLTIKDVSVQRAEDILNEIITVYNENWIEDKNKMAIATSQFISERLNVIEKELSEVDANISDYKADHLLTDLQESSSLYMTAAARTTEEMVMVNNQLAMARYMKEYIADPKHKEDVIPVNTGIGNPTLEAQIPAYNQLLLNRDVLKANSSANNPMVRDMDAQLKGMHASIVSAIDAQIVGLNKTLANMQQSKGQNESHLASTPSQALYLLSIERQQKVKEALYIYLLQKREENELTQTFTAYNTRIITPPYGPGAPISPKRNLVLMIAFVLGLAIPGAAMFMAENGNTRIRSRKDLENLSVPFLGEVPFFGKSRRWRNWISTKKQKQKAIDTPLKVVAEGNRDVTNEAFRVMRSNIEAMSGRNAGSQTLMLTSFNAGSGKSFIAYNLGEAFSLKGKKVLLVDADLRHGSLSMYGDSAGKGLTDYLTGRTDNWESAVTIPAGGESAILPIGHRPPNPAELLESPRFSQMLTEAKEKYDYVIVDCPPVDIVADTQLVAPYADRTLFVVRAGVFELDAVPELDELYRSGRYHQMGVILNGTSGKNSRFHTYGSSYYGEV